MAELRAKAQPRIFVSPANLNGAAVRGGGFFAACERALARASLALAVAGGTGLLFAIAVTCASIAGRLCRRALVAVGAGDWPLAAHLGPILGEEELVQYAVGLALFAALPWLTLEGGHARVDLCQRFFSRRINRALELAGQLALAALAYLIFTRQWYLIFKKARRGQESFGEALLGGDWSGAAQMLRWQDESQILGIKLAPIYAAAEICVALWFAVCCFCVARAARDWLRALRPAPPQTKQP